MGWGDPLNANDRYTYEALRQREEDRRRDEEDRSHREQVEAERRAREASWDANNSSNSWWQNNSKDDSDNPRFDDDNYYSYTRVGNSGYYLKQKKYELFNMPSCKEYYENKSLLENAEDSLKAFGQFGILFSFFTTNFLVFILEKHLFGFVIVILVISLFAGFQKVYTLKHTGKNQKVKICKTFFFNPYKMLSTFLVINSFIIGNSFGAVILAWGFTGINDIFPKVLIAVVVELIIESVILGVFYLFEEKAKKLRIKLYEIATGFRADRKYAIFFNQPDKIYEYEIGNNMPINTHDVADFMKELKKRKNIVQERGKKWPINKENF